MNLREHIKSILKEATYLKRRFSPDRLEKEFNDALNYMSRGLEKNKKKWNLMNLKKFTETTVTVMIDQLHLELSYGGTDYFPYDEIHDVILEKYSDRIKERYNKILGIINESQEINRLKRILPRIDELVEYGLNTHYQPKKICGKYKDPGELVDVVSAWVAERVYYDYFGNIDDSSDVWEEIWHKINQYVIKNYAERIEENFSEDCW